MEEQKLVSEGVSNRICWSAKGKKKTSLLEVRGEYFDWEGWFFFYNKYFWYIVEKESNRYYIFNALTLYFSMYWEGEHNVLFKERKKERKKKYSKHGLTELISFCSFLSPLLSSFIEHLLVFKFCALHLFVPNRQGRQQI